jgi:excisionase family DNA binding protein
MTDMQRELSEMTYSEGALTIGGAIEFTGIGRSTLYALMGRGELPYTKVGTRRLIPRRALVALLAAHATRPVGD